MKRPEWAPITSTAGLPRQQSIPNGATSASINGSGVVGMTNTDFIDVWNVESFDTCLLEELRANAELIHSYHLTEKKNFHEYTSADRWIPYPGNPYAGAYYGFVEWISRQMELRTIRAWHYTRLTNAEADIIRHNGVHVCTETTIRQRLEAQVSAGAFSPETADELFAASPLHTKSQRPGRLGKFWMVSYPVKIDDLGVELSWGTGAGRRSTSGSKIPH